jgi:hypothetical protein
VAVSQGADQAVGTDLRLLENGRDGDREDPDAGRALAAAEGVDQAADSEPAAQADRAALLDLPAEVLLGQVAEQNVTHEGRLDLLKLTHPDVAQTSLTG